MIFGFLLTICFDPNLWYGATVPRWALLAVTLPLLTAFASPNHFTVSHLVGLVFVVWSTISLLWCANIYDGLGDLLQVLILAQAFVLGARLQSVEHILSGMALGMAVNTASVLITHNNLFFNTDMAAECAAMIAMGLICYRKWLFLPFVLPTLFWPPIARGAILGFLAGICCWLWPRSRWAAALLAGAMLIGGFYALDIRPLAVEARIDLWTGAWRGIDWLGHGLGSLPTLYPWVTHSWDTMIERPDHAHNELIEILFDLGVIGLLGFVGMVCTSLYRSSSVLAPALATISVISLVAFPLNIPATAFIAALVIGNLAGSGPGLRSYFPDWRLVLFRILSRWLPAINNPATN